MYIVKDRKLIGLPETPGLTKAVFKLNFKDVSLSFEKPILYKYNDAVFGETYQPFEIIPEISLAFEDEVIILKMKNLKRFQ